MSEVLKINTEDGLVTKEFIDPFIVYLENNSLLTDNIDEFPEEEILTEDFQKFIRQLKHTRTVYKGIGLAANQCGYPVRAFVIGSGDFEVVCINPRIKELSNELVNGKEGCLSYPGLFLNIRRPKWIVAEYIDETGKHQEVRYEGMTARIFCHELDHLDGVRFTDRVGKVSLEMAKNKQKKLIRKYKKLIR